MRNNLRMSKKCCNFVRFFGEVHRLNRLNGFFSGQKLSKIIQKLFNVVNNYQQLKTILGGYKGYKGN